MTATGVVEQLGNGEVMKEYLYEELNVLVDIVFNSAGQILQASVVKSSSTSGGSTATATTVTTSSQTSLVVTTLTPTAAATSSTA